tara:strand:- start:6625 stop:15102 length:8478 start_codon:yes stop_codon:yes gene_type:complete
MSKPPEDLSEILKGLQKKPRSFAEILDESQERTVPEPYYGGVPDFAPEKKTTISYPGGEVPVQKADPYLTKQIINRPSSSPEALNAALSLRSAQAPIKTREEYEKMLEPAWWQTALKQLEPFDYPRGTTWAALAYAAGAVLPDADTEAGKALQGFAGDFARFGGEMLTEGKQTGDAFENLGEYMYSQIANGSIYKNAREFHGDVLPWDFGERVYGGIPNVTGDVILDHVLPRSLAKKMADTARAEGNETTADFFDVFTNETSRFIAGIVPEFIVDPLWALGPAKGGQVVNKGGKVIMMSPEAAQAATSASRISETQKLEGLVFKKITGSDNARRLTIDVIEGQDEAVAAFRELSHIGTMKMNESNALAARYAEDLKDPAKVMATAKEDIEAIRGALGTTIKHYAAGGGRLKPTDNLLKSMGLENTPAGLKALDDFNNMVASAKLGQLRKTEKVLATKLEKMSDVKYATNYLTHLHKAELKKAAIFEADVARIDNILELGDNLKKSMIDTKGWLTLHVPLTRRQLNIKGGLGRTTFQITPKLGLGDTAATIAERVGLQQVDLAKLNGVSIEGLSQKIARGEKITVALGASGLSGFFKGLSAHPILRKIGDAKDWVSAWKAPQRLRNLSAKPTAERTMGEELLIQIFRPGRPVGLGKVPLRMWDFFAKTLGTRWLQPKLAIRRQAEGLLYFEQRGVGHAMRKHMTASEMHWIRLRETSPELWENYQQALGKYLTDIKTAREDIRDFLQSISQRAQHIAEDRKAREPELYSQDYTGMQVLDEVHAIRESGAGQFPPELAGVVIQIRKMLEMMEAKTGKSFDELQQTLLALYRYGHGDPEAANDIQASLVQLSKAIKKAEIEKHDVVENVKTAITDQIEALNNRLKARVALKKAFTEGVSTPEELAILKAEHQKAIKELNKAQTARLAAINKLRDQKLAATTADYRKARRKQKVALKKEAKIKPVKLEQPEEIQARRDADYKKLEQQPIKIDQTSIDTIKAQRASERVELEKTLQAEAAPKVDTAMDKKLWELKEKRTLHKKLTSEIKSIIEKAENEGYYYHTDKVFTSEKKHRQLTNARHAWANPREVSRFIKQHPDFLKYDDEHRQIVLEEYNAWESVPIYERMALLAELEQKVKRKLSGKKFKTTEEGAEKYNEQLLSLKKERKNNELSFRTDVDEVQNSIDVNKYYRRFLETILSRYAQESKKDFNIQDVIRDYFRWMDEALDKDQRTPSLDNYWLVQKAAKKFNAGRKLDLYETGDSKQIIEYLIHHATPPKAAPKVDTAKELNEEYAKLYAEVASDYKAFEANLPEIKAPKAALKDFDLRKQHEKAVERRTAANQVRQSLMYAGKQVLKKDEELKELIDQRLIRDKILRPGRELTAAKNKYERLIQAQPDDARIQRLNWLKDNKDFPPKAAPKAPKVDTTKALKAFDDETAKMVDEATAAGKGEAEEIAKAKLLEHQTETKSMVEAAKQSIAQHEQRIEKANAALEKKLLEFDEETKAGVAEKKAELSKPILKEAKKDKKAAKHETTLAKRQKKREFKKARQKFWEEPLANLKKLQEVANKQLEKIKAGKFDKGTVAKLETIDKRIANIITEQQKKQQALELVTPKMVAERITTNHKGEAYVRDLMEWEKDLWVDARQLMDSTSVSTEEFLQAIMKTLEGTKKYLGDPKSVEERANTFKILQEKFVGQPVGRAKLPKGRRKEDEIKFQEERREVARLRKEGPPEEYQAAAKALDEKQIARMEGMSQLPTVVGERYTAEISEDIKPLVEMLSEKYAAYEEAYKQHGFTFMRSPHERRMLWGVEGYVPHMRFDAALPIQDEAQILKSLERGAIDRQLSIDMDQEKMRKLSGTIEEINALPRGGSQDSNWKFAVSPQLLMAQFFNSSKALSSVDFLWSLNQGGVIRTFTTLEEATKAGYVPLYNRGERQKEFEIMMSGTLGEMQFIDAQGRKIEDAYKILLEAQEEGAKVESINPLMSWVRDIKQVNETQTVEQAVMGIRMHQYRYTKAQKDPVVPLVGNEAFNVKTRLEEIVEDRMTKVVAKIDNDIKVAYQELAVIQGKKTASLQGFQKDIADLEAKINELKKTIAKKQAENKGTKNLEKQIQASQKKIATLQKRGKPDHKDKFLPQIVGKQKQIDKLTEMKNPDSEAYGILKAKEKKNAWDDLTEEINSHVAAINSHRKRHPELADERLPNISKDSLQMFFEPNKSGPLYRQYIPEGVEESMRIMLTPKDMPGWAQKLHQWNNWWKTRVTVMATAFTVRNMIGNTYQNALDVGWGGALNPFTCLKSLHISNLADHFARHGSLRNAHEYYKAPRRAGEKALEYVNRKRQGIIFSNIYDPKKLNTIDLGDGILRDMDEALGMLHDRGVISGSSTFHADLDMIESDFMEMAHALGTAEAKGGGARFKRVFSHVEDAVITSLGPLSGFASGSFFAFTAMPKKWGQTFSRRAENQGRMINFIANMKRGGTVEEATAHTNKFLMNYSDLTPAQRDWMRLAIPFFTWNHKNFILHLDMMQKNPQFFAQFYRTAYEFLPRMFQSIRDEEKQRPTDPVIAARKRAEDLKYQPEYNLYKIRLDVQPDNNIIIEGFGLPIESFAQQVASLGGIVTEIVNFAGFDTPKSHLSSLQENPATFHYAAAQSHFALRALLEWGVLKEYMFYQRPFDDPRSHQVQDIAATVVHLKNSNFLPFVYMANAIEEAIPMHSVVDPRSGKLVHYLSDTKLMARKYAYDVSPWTRYIAGAAKVSDEFHTANLTERAMARGGEKVISRTPLTWRLINAMSGIKIKQDLPDQVAEEIHRKKIKKLMMKEADLKGFTTGGQILRPPRGE